MTGLYRIGKAEVGLLTASASEPASVPSQFRLLHLPGLSVDHLQYWRLSVVATDTGLEREHIVMMAYYPVLADQVCDEIATLLRPLYPMALLSFVQADSEGHAKVRADSHTAEVAAAVTEVKRQGGWDESSMFRIVVQSQPFEVTIRWLTDHAEAIVKADAA